MDKHMAWTNNSVVAPESVGSMTTNGQTKQTFRVNLKASQAGGNSQSIVSTKYLSRSAEFINHKSPMKFHESTASISNVEST